MSYKILELKEPIKVYGVQGTASLQREELLQTAVIPFIWDYVNSEAFPEPEQKEVLYGVLQHEQLNRDSSFIFTAGATFPSELKETDIENAIMAETEIQPGKYLVFEATGKQTEMSVKLWVEAWEYLDSPDCPYERRYDSDFEEYLDYNPDKCPIRIHVGVREKSGS